MAGEKLSGRTVREKLGQLAQRAVVFVETGLNPLGCGMAGNGLYEVHDHTIGMLSGDENNLVVVNNKRPFREVREERYDPSIHGEITGWVKEGEEIPFPDGVGLKVKHSHIHSGSGGTSGPHEY